VIVDFFERLTPSALLCPALYIIAPAGKEKHTGNPVFLYRLNS
jgi:hypothetical protein